MTLHQQRPAKPVPVARAIALNLQERRRLTLLRLLSTALIGGALLTGSALYAKADEASSKVKTTTQQQQIKPDALKKAAEAATKDSDEEKAKLEKTKPESEKVETDKPVTEKAGESGTPLHETKEVAQGLELPDYLDDRSTPQKLLESYYNAINRKEYARAYSYYDEGTHEPDFNNYAKGYENTQSVKIKLGSTEPDPGAGQIYWTMPLAIESTASDGKKQVYTGCYTIHMTNPTMQEQPPYKPMSIMTGTLSKSPKALDESVPEECEAP